MFPERAREKEVNVTDSLTSLIRPSIMVTAMATRFDPDARWRREVTP